MNSIKEDVQQAVELLIQEFEKAPQRYRFREEKTKIEATVSVGSLIVHYSTNQQLDEREKLFDFTIIFEGISLFRGVIGYTPILYTKQNQKLRDRILGIESIKGVITIHHSGFGASQITMILFDKTDSSTWFVNCDDVKDVVSVLLQEQSEAVEIHCSDTIQPENFLPEYYSEEEKAISHVFKGVNTKRLEELAEIIPGKGANSADYLDHGIPYLRARDIQKGSIISPSVNLSPEMASSYSRQLLQEGDILLTKNFGQRKLALVKEDNLPGIASNALYIIRPFGVSEKYLYRYLTSNTGNTVFNTQLKRIEKGSVVSAIALADLKNILIPVYDEEIMLEIEQMDALCEEESIEAALRIIQKIGNTPESDIERHVFMDLIEAGWEESRFSSQNDFLYENRRQWAPDLTYTLPDGTKVFFEIKKNLSSVSKEWALAVSELLFGSTKCYYILTTGLYYEIHFTGVDESLKVFHVPSTTEITDWERGLN